MPKIFDRQLEDKRIRRLNEDAWFRMHQKELLWLANTSEGRDFLCIDKKFPVIHEIAKNYVRHHGLVMDKKSPTGWRRITTTEFRMGAKYANIIRSRWEQWLDYRADYSVALFLRTMPKQYVPSFALVGDRVASVMRTTSTFYPDPDAETTSVDGRVARVSVDEAFSTIRAGAGNFAADTETGGTQHVRLICSETPSTNQYSQLVRSIYLFDTSSIPDTDTVDSGTISIYGTAKQNDIPLTAAHAALSIVATTPASNTALVNADYGQVSTTRQATDLAYADFSTTAYNDITLNATGVASISKTGVTKFGSAFAVDTDAGSPAWASLAQSSMSAYYADQTGTTNDPKLVVVHSAAAAAGGSVPTLLLMGIG